MSEEIKPKKERKFLKALGKIGEVLIQELFFKVGSNLIRKIGGKKTLPSILFLFLSLGIFAQFPNTGNKQRLGFQTTGDGLVWRGSLSDTASIQPINNQNAWVILDTINLKFYSFDFTSNLWNLVGGTSGLTMPFDSITFNTAKNGTVGVGEVEYNDTQGSLIQGLKGGNVTNVIGQQLHQRVNNRTGATLAKGTAVYLSGSQGNRITVAKALATSDPTSANTFGIVAESIDSNQSGFIITEGLITGLNTSTLTEDSAVYLSPTVAGALTSTKPQAPQHSVYIGVCVKSNNGSGELFVKIRNGQELDELHDTRITNPVTGATLFYSGGLWRDTTAALLVSDTASMLANYATKTYADTTGRLYARQDFTNVLTSTLTWTQSDTLIPGGVNVVQVYRNGQILLPSQYTIPTSTSVVIAASSFKVNDNYTVIFPRGGGAGSGGGSGSLTSISGGTGIIVSPNPITTTGTVSADLSVLMELTDTSLLNLTSRFNTKQNTLISGTNIKTVNSNSLLGSGNISVGTLVAADTVSLSNRINTKLNATDTTSLSNRINLKLNAADTASLSNRIDAKGTGTVTNIATGYGITGGAITTTGTLVLDSAVVFSRIRDSIVDVAIGNDTIKILKQEYAPATTSVLTWTVTSKFPIQSKSFILVFRNGQLLINTQYNLTDTNKITIVSNSFKVGANYTVVTVSGIGSVGTGVFPNPVYPESGIALSTGSAWASSIPNNSSNWNIAFNDKINNAEFTGTNTKTLTLTQYDGGTFTPTFTDLQGVTGVTAGTGLTGGTITSTGTVAVDFTTVAPLASPTFTGTVSGITKSMVGLGNVDNTSDANKPVSTATQTALNLKVNISDTASMLTPYFRDADTTQLNLTSRFNTKQNTLNGTGFVKANGTSITYDNSTYLTTGTAASTYLPLTGGTLTGDLFTKYLNTFAKTTYIPFNSGIGEQSIFNVGATLRGGTVMIFPDSNLVGSSANIFLANSSVQGVEYSAMGSGMRNYAKQGGDTRRNSLAFYTSGIGSQNTNRLFIDFDGNVGINDDTPSFKLDVNGTLNATGATTLGSTLAVTGNITEAGNNVLTNLDTASLSSRIDLKLNKTDTTTMLNKYWRSGNFSGTLPIANGGTGAENASLARKLLSVDYAFAEVSAGSSVTITSNRVSIVNTGGFSTTQLDLTPATNGRMYMIKNLATGTVTSLHSNVIPFGGGSPTTAILSAGNVTPQWVTLVADGTNWHMVQKN